MAANFFTKLFKKSEVKEVSEKGEVIADNIVMSDSRQIENVTNENKSLKELIKENGKGYQYQSIDKAGNTVTMEVSEIVEHPGGGFVVYSRSV